MNHDVPFLKQGLEVERHRLGRRSEPPPPPAGVGMSLTGDLGSLPRGRKPVRAQERGSHGARRGRTQSCLVPFVGSLHLARVPRMGVWDTLGGTRPPWAGTGGFGRGLTEI